MDWAGLDGGRWRDGGVGSALVLSLEPDELWLEAGGREGCDPVGGPAFDRLAGYMGDFIVE